MLEVDDEGGRTFLRVLIHLTMHDYPPLVSGALQLLFKHFSQRQEAMHTFKQVLPAQPALGGRGVPKDHLHGAGRLPWPRAACGGHWGLAVMEEELTARLGSRPCCAPYLLGTSTTAWLTRSFPMLWTAPPAGQLGRARLC